MASFAEKLKALRGQNHMTQAQLAAALNVARSTVAGYETKSREPSHDKLNVMADLFHVSVDYLLDDSPVELPLLMSRTLRRPKRSCLQDTVSCHSNRKRSCYITWNS